MCTKNNSVIKKLWPKQHFGDIQMLVNTPAYFTYKPETENVVLYEISFLSISEVLGDNFKEEISYCMFKNAFQNADKLIDYLMADVKNIFNLFRLRYYKIPDIVYMSSHKKHKKMCVVLSGKLSKKKEIVAKTEDLFGEFIVESKEKYY